MGGGKTESNWYAKVHTMKIMGKFPTKQNRSTRVNRRQFRRVDALAVRQGHGVR